MGDAEAVAEVAGAALLPALAIPSGWRERGLGVLRRGVLRDTYGRFFTPTPSAGCSLVPPEEAVVVLQGTVFKARADAAVGRAASLRSTLGGYGKKKLHAEARVKETAGTESVGAWRRELASSERRIMQVAKKLEAAEAEEARALAAVETEAGALSELAAAQAGLLAFARVIKQVWWEKDSEGNLVLVGYVPRFRFGTTLAAMYQGKALRMWAAVGPFRVRAVYAPGGMQCFIPPEPTAHFSGNPQGSYRNYHPHVMTSDNLKICWGSYSALEEEARTDVCGFSLLAVADRLLTSCERGRLYDCMFQWWDHRPRGLECLCPACAAWVKVHPKGKGAGECRCFGCRMARGEKLPKPPPDVVWPVDQPTPVDLRIEPGGDPTGGKHGE